MTLPSCISAHPNPFLDASQNTSNDFSISGCARTGAVVSNFRKVQKAASHSFVQANLCSFYSRLVIDLAIFEKSGMKCQ
jgi:hypothetical protein